MSEEWKIEVERYGGALDVEDAELEEIEEIYEEGDIGRHFSDEVLVLARDPDGDIIGAITESGGDELTFGVAEDWQGEGLGVSMLKALLEAGGGGYFMVAGTNAGAAFLDSLYWKLTPDERELLDVPSWSRYEEDEV